jgi:hypothetical protein
MTATLTPNREAALSALWWLFEGAVFYVFLADTTGAAPPPAQTDDYTAWTPYFLNDEFDTFTASGTADYDATSPQRAVLPQQEINLNFASEVTFTDVVIFVIPAIDSGVDSPIHSAPQIAVIHESSAITLAAGATKIYKLDLYSEWI